MATEGEKKKFLAKNKPPAIELEKTICIETFRLVSLVALCALFAAAKIFSKQFVFLPEEDEGHGRSLLSFVKDAAASFLPQGDEGSGRFLSSLRGGAAGDDGGRRLGGFVLFGQEHPYVHLKETTIWKTFGVAHACSFIDYHPAKEVGAILLPFFSLPMTIFIVLAHYRNQLVYANNPASKEAKDLYWYSRVTTYFTIAVFQLTHLWFVNDPEQSYPKGVGFVGHYIPYALFQTALGVIAVMQVKYDITIDRVPFGVSPGLARRYVAYLWLLTVAYQAVVVAILMDKPLIDARNGGWEEIAFNALMKLYSLASMVVPIACSIWTIKHSGDTNTFKMAIQ